MGAASGRQHLHNNKANHDDGPPLTAASCSPTGSGQVASPLQITTPVWLVTVPVTSQAARPSAVVTTSLPIITLACSALSHVGFPQTPEEFFRLLSHRGHCVEITQIMFNFCITDTHPSEESLIVIHTDELASTSIVVGNCQAG